MRLEDFDKAVSLKENMDDLSDLLEAKMLLINGIRLPDPHYVKLVKLIEVARDDVRAQLRHLIGDRSFPKNAAEAIRMALDAPIEADEKS